jgi:hypothetical protein
VPVSQVDVSNISTLRTRLDSLSLHPVEGSQLGSVHSLLRETREMLHGANRNPLTVLLTSTLCVLQATAAGLSLWAAPYLAYSASAPPPLVSLLCSAFILSTAPAAGTYAGALLCDRLEGFKAGHHAVALRVGCGFVSLAALTAPCSSAATSFLLRLVLIACWLFGAGAFLPISAGLIMTSMPSYLRSFSSASVMLVYHIVSFSIVPGVVAVLMTCFTEPEEGLSFGLGLLLWATTPVALLLLISYIREPKAAMSAGTLSSVDDLSFSDISYELARRRMSTAPL